MIQSNILLTDIVIPTVDNLIVTDVPDEVIVKDSDIISTNLTITSLNSEFLPQESQNSPSLLDLNTTEFNNLSNEIVVTPTIQNNGMLLNTDIPVYDNAVTTDLSLNTNSPSNNDVLGSYESVNAIPSITPGSGSLFPSDPAELPQINSLFELLQYLSEVMMRFNSDPNYYMQDDFAILVKTITNALIHLYLNAPLSTGEVEGLYAALGTKVDKILGKGLSTNDLTNELKAAYDQAFLETHIHNNKSALDLVSGENTGDQDLSGLQLKETGKGLSTNDFTTLDKNKLDSIQVGAEVNVNADWNAVSGDALILNKPSIPSITGLATETYVQTYAEPKKGIDDNYVTDIEKSNLHAPHSDDQDLSELVVKIPGYSLVSNVDIAKIHLPHSDDQDLTPYETISNNNIKLATKEPANSNIQAHIANTNNPHNTTKLQVGLGSVDNTPDVSKPVSTPQKTYIDAGDRQISTGALIAPTFTDNGNGTGTISSTSFNMFTTSDFSGNMITVVVPSTTLTFTDGLEEYVAVSYNAGNPIYYKETVGSAMNHSNLLPMFVIWRQGLVLHSLGFDSLGAGLANKLQSATYHTQEYRLSSDGGLSISETTSPNPRTIVATGGLVYTGAVSQIVNAFTSVTDQLTFAYHVSGVWTYTDHLVYNNTQYDNGTNLITINNNKYAVRWYYRSIGDSNQMFYVSGTGGNYNNPTDAALESPRTDLPMILKHHCMLIGRSIIQLNATSGITQDLVQDIYSFSTTVNHNDTGNIQLAGSGVTYGHIDTNEQSIYGTKTFINSPLVPNITPLDNSTKVANTAYVDTKLPLQTIIDTKGITGFIDSDNINVSYNYTNRTITLTGNLSYVFRGVAKTLTSPWTSSAHAATQGTWFLYSTDGINFNWSQTLWNFEDIMVTSMRYGASAAASFAIRETHGTMDYETHEELHSQIGTYRVSGGQVTVGSYIYDTATNSAISPGFDSAVVKDEDISSTIPTWVKGTYTTAYVGAGNTMVFNVASTVPFIATTNTYIQVNNPTTGTLTPSVNNNYYNVYQILIPATSDVDSQKYRMIMLQPQNTYSSLALAQAEDVRGLVLGNLTTLSLEFVIYTRITYTTLAADSNIGKCRIATNGITYNIGNRSGQVSVAGFTGNNHATLSNLSWLTSGHIGTANKLPAFDASGLATELTVNSAFNKNFGTTPGTVLEGRTFGTAANNNTGDFYATGSTVANSTLWNSQSYVGGTGTPIYLMTHNGAGWGYDTVGTLKNWLGLGSSAYVNTSSFIQNQNTSAQSANMWISGSSYSEGGFKTKGRVSNSNNGNILWNDGTGENLILAETAPSVYSFGSGPFGTVTTPTFSINTNTKTATFASTVNATQLQSTVATGTAPLTVNSTTMVSNLKAQYLGYNVVVGNANMQTNAGAYYYNTGSSNVPASGRLLHLGFDGNTWSSQILITEGNNKIYFREQNNSTWQSWNEIYHSGNLTNTLTTNYLPKWNGSSMVNSLISDLSDRIISANNIILNNSSIDQTTNKSVGALVGQARTYGQNNQSGIASIHFVTDPLNWYKGGISFRTNNVDGTDSGTPPVERMFIDKIGDIKMFSTTQSTSPTTGALVVNGGIGVGGKLFTENDIIVGNASNNKAVICRYIASIDDGFLGLNSFGGNTSIGYTTDQGYKLAVNGTGYFNGNVTLGGGNITGVGTIVSSNAQISNAVYFNGTNNYWNFDFAANAINTNGHLKVVGNVTASNFILSSDRTLKTNIQSIIKDYSKLNLVSFNFRNNLEELRFGTIAQDLLSSGFSEFVTGDKEGEYKVKYIDLIIAKLASAELRIKQLEEKYGCR